MAKKQYTGNITFDASAQSIVLDGNIQRDRLLLITNVTDNIIIYSFADSTTALSAYSYSSSTDKTTLTLGYDTTSMDDADTLQIFFEDAEGQHIKPSEDLLDPVSKMRISQPQNLIDTDFEYGLQGQKWETLEQVRNIPTFFARDGEETVPLTSISTVNGSDIVTVVTSVEHGYSKGTPFILVGTSQPQVNGGNIVSNVLSTTSFQFKAKATMTATTDVKDEYTQLFTGNIYTGTEFRTGGLTEVSTDEAAQSTLTVTTKFPNRFTKGTELFLSNSLSTVATSFDATIIEGDDNTTTSFTINPVSDEDPDSTGHWKSAAPRHDVFKPIGKVKYFLPADCSVSDNIITFSSAHGLETGTYYYSAGYGNASAFTGVRNEFYYFVHVHSTTQISLHSNVIDCNNDNSRHPITAVVNDSNTNYGVARHYFAKAYLYTSATNDTLIDASNISTTLAGDRFSDLYDAINGATGQTFAIGPGFDSTENAITHEGIGFVYDTSPVGVSGSSISGDFLAYRYSEGIFFRIVEQDLTGNGIIYKEDHGLLQDQGVTVDFTPLGDVTINTQAEFDRWFPYRLGAVWQEAGTGTGTGSTGGFSDSGAGGGHIRFDKDPYDIPDEQKDELIKPHLNNDNFDMRSIVSREILLEGSSDDWGFGDDESTFSVAFKAIAGNGSNGGDTPSGTLSVGVRDLGDFTTTYQQSFSLTSSWADYTFTGTARLNRPFQVVFRYEHNVFSADENIGIDEIVFDADTNFFLGNTEDYHMKVDRVDANRFRLLNPAGGTFYYAGNPLANFTVESTRELTDTDSIVLNGHGLTDEAEVTYDVNGNTAISGLVNGTTYFVTDVTTNKFKLATSADGEDGESVELWQYRSTQANGIGRGGAESTIYIGTHANAVSEGYTTGTRVQYTAPVGKPLVGLTDGGYYFIRLFQNGSGGWVRLYRSAADANANTNHLKISDTDSDAKGTLQKVTIVDIETGTGTHKLTATTAGGADGIYAISRVVDSQNFELTTGSQINKRTISLGQTSIDQKNNAIYSRNHGLTSGTPLTLTGTGTAPGEMNDGSTTIFYAIRVNDDYFRVASLAEDVDSNTFLTLDDAGTGSTSLETTSVIGETSATGTVSIEADSKTVTGIGTKFASQFREGDTFIVYEEETTADLNVTSVSTGDDEFTDGSHGLSDGDLLRVLIATTDLTLGELVYAHASTTTTPADTFTVHRTRADALTGSNPVDITVTTSGALFTNVSDIGDNFEAVVDFVNSATQLTLKTAPTTAFSAAPYVLTSNLVVRANGFALHRPFDGGVDLVPAQNPDGQMIRQTRKYFRYQSGKGIQISNGINFSPSVPIMDMSVENTDSTSKAIVTTRYPHRLKDGVSITISGATVSAGTNYWNGTFTVQSAIDDYKFEIALTGEPTDASSMGSPSFVVNAWSGAAVKSGIFDDQNGLFFEYDGNKLYCVHRTSTEQISGNCVVELGSGQLTGVDTKFASQLAVDDKIVIRGQTYQITRIDSNSRLFFMPSYRGQDADGVIVSKIVDNKIAQENWSIDPCDGTGPFGYVLDIHKMQMAYVDYSWYGAGKVRFGFKDQQGRVKYVHEFINNNKQTEAYMRSGNLPVRYEIENIGDPTFVPSLAHWGTSVIMDGRFDSDDSYVFTASAQNVSITGDASLTVSGKVELDDKFRIKDPNNNYPVAGFALTLENPDPKFDGIFDGATITGANLATGTKVTQPSEPLGSLRLPVTPYFPSVTSATAGNFAGESLENSATRSLLLLDKEPTGTSGSNSSYTVTLASAATPVTVEQPLISIRLAPSVDSGTPGLLGERELINRMQLIMDSVQVLSTHGVEVSILLNATLDRNDWKAVDRPSLSQLLYHGAGDTAYNGVKVFSFKAEGDDGTSNRTARSTYQHLENLDAIGNSILGGNGRFPDGPDVLTVVAKLSEDPSTVSNSNPFNISGKISWSESQA